MTPEMAGRRSEASWPRQTAGIKLKVGGRKRLRHESFTVDAIEGDVVTVKTGDGQETSIREGGDCPYGAGAIG
jgi:hypothetical protein